MYLSKPLIFIEHVKQSSLKSKDHQLSVHNVEYLLYCFTVGGLLHVHEKVNNFKFNIFINFSGAQYDTNAVDRTLCGENEGIQISCAGNRAADQGLCFHICK